MYQSKAVKQAQARNSLPSDLVVSSEDLTKAGQPRLSLFKWPWLPRGHEAVYQRQSLTWGCADGLAVHGENANDRLDATNGPLNRGRTPKPL